jgi:cell division protein FtsI/penicillin-binding protein 2
MQQPSSHLDVWQRRLGAALLSVVALVLVGMGGRLVYIQQYKGPPLLELAARQQYGSTTVPARRGMILDRTGRVVAASRRTHDVFVDPSLLEVPDGLSQEDAERLKNDLALELASELAAKLNLQAEDVFEKLTKRKNARFVVIAEAVDDVSLDAVRALRRPAVGFRERGIRTYALGASMPHVLGFTGREGPGLEGVEKAHNEHLSGSDGVRSTIRDQKRRAIWRTIEGDVNPQDGGHVVLTLDAEIQRITEQAIADRATELHAESAIGMVMDPRTGEILAMACWPTFDPANAASVKGELRRNRILTDPIEPGSVFKPFVATGALAGKFIGRDELINCHYGTYKTRYRTIKDVSPQGAMNLKGILAKSSNIGMAMIAERMGRKPLYDTLRTFGFGDPTGIDLPGEHPGRLASPSKWSALTITSIPMGYEMLATPLQLLTGFSAIVNDGVLLRPRVVKALLGPDGEVIQSFDEPEVVRQVAPREVLDYLARDLLVNVIEEGSGGAAKLDDYSIIGKTGTTKLRYRDHRKGYEPGQYQAAFLGAGPASNPRVAVLVLIRRPDARIEYYGGKVAAPPAGRILDATLRYLKVPPDKNLAENRVAGL